MIIVFLNFFILLLKFLGMFFLSVIINSSIILKLFLLTAISFIIYFIYMYKPKKKDAEEIYNIHNIFENVFNLCMVIIFMLFFIFGIFFLRIKNSSNHVNLKTVYAQGLDLFYNITLENIINITLIIFSCILYLLVITKVMRYLKKHLIKRHIKLSNNTFYLQFIAYLRNNISILNFFYKVSSKTFKLFMEYPLKKKIS